MTNETILKKAISKAKKNGYEVTKNDIKNLLENYKLYPCLILNALIFSHSFAKAFWGEEVICFNEKKWGWKYHLQQMVLELKPLNYIKKFL